MVRVNVENGELIPIRKIENLPPDAVLRNLVYVPKDTAFYSTMNTRSEPVLIKLRADGSWENLGWLTQNGKRLYFCEAMTYDEANDQLILSASIDGAIPGDANSEALFRVNRTTAKCELLATIRKNPPPNDFDEIAIFNNQLFALDGVPGRNTTYIFPFNTNDLNGRELFAGTKQNIPYFTMDDVVVVGQLLYFPDNISKGWYFFDLLGRRWFEVGKIHGPASLGTIKLTGLAYLPLSQA